MKNNFRMSFKIVSSRPVQVFSQKNLQQKINLLSGIRESQQHRLHFC